MDIKNFWKTLVESVIFALENPKERQKNNRRSAEREVSAGFPQQSKAAVGKFFGLRYGSLSFIRA